MRIVVDRNIRGAEATFGQHGDLLQMDGRDIRKRDLEGADLLIIRTATKANAELLAGTPVRFVGTTSIGTDHLDIPWLEQQGIAWSNAPGCNADSAAQYTLAMMALACRRLGWTLEDQRVGIIGRGNVGSRVRKLLDALGVENVANDPPLRDEGVANLVSQAEALACDIVTLHVPLTRDGPYPTWQMIGSEQLARMPAGALLVNAARGDVVQGSALLDAVRSDKVHAALDVWPGEPLLNPELLERSVVATPHVAGYSDDGKRNGTWIVYEAFCKWSGQPPVARDGFDSDRLSLTIAKSEDALTEALQSACFVAAHDRALKELSSLGPEEIARGFDRLRKEYPFRRDFRGWDVSCSNPPSCRLLHKIGFSVYQDQP